VIFPLFLWKLPQTISNEISHNSGTKSLKSRFYRNIAKFGFSELGWPSLKEFGGEKAQADFLLNVSTRLTIEKGVKLLCLATAGCMTSTRMIIWG